MAGKSPEPHFRGQSFSFTGDVEYEVSGSQSLVLCFELKRYLSKKVSRRALKIDRYEWKEDGDLFYGAGKVIATNK